MGARVGAADWVLFFDDGKESGIISRVDRVGEVVVGIFDEDGAVDIVFLDYCGHGIDDISGLLLGVGEFNFAAFVGSQGVEKFLESDEAIAML